jgi:hypothetical protein
VQICHPGSGGSGIYISPAVLPEFAPALPYSYQLPITGGVAPYTVTLVSTDINNGFGPQTPGSWPQGIGMSSGGLISGTPIQGGRWYGTRTATFVVHIVDANGTSTNATLTAPYVFNVVAW